MSKPTVTNPWITATVTETPEVLDPQPAPSPTMMPTRPRPGAVLPPHDGGLPIRHLDPNEQAPWWWLGCHGGAGVGMLSATFPDGRDADRHWPVPGDGTSTSVLLVARTNVPGLRAAQTAARQWASGGVPQVRLLGLVAVADAPGTLPKPLRDLLKLVAGAFPRTWAVPWMEPWRFGETPPVAELPKPLARLAGDLSHVVARNRGSW
ncbi:DUF6668 family protein [Embleya sp. NPDC005575]|uniref:DUF6668 family protein n=1 Tax=Embleya sp. NPDC005575 TaxID=3156892 RepID=UPI0033A03D10